MSRPMNDLIRDPLDVTPDDLDEYIELRQKCLIMAPYLWERYKTYIEKFTYVWNETKFLIDNKFNDKGFEKAQKFAGIYFIYIKPSLTIDDSIKYLVYIGQASKTSAGNDLYARFKTYFNVEYKGKKPRPAFKKLFKYWSDNVYIKYVLFDKNDDLDDLETALIGAYLPVLNTEIRDAEVRYADRVAMF